VLTVASDQAEIDLIVANVGESTLSIDDSRGVRVDWRAL
jgi:hypothetical protein